MSPQGPASRFLAPTRRTWTLTALFFSLPYAAVALHLMVPRSWIVSDVTGPVAKGLAFVFFRAPLALFDLATGGAFAPKGDGSFIVFPTLPQIGFVGLAGAAASYLLARAVCRAGRRTPDDT